MKNVVQELARWYQWKVEYRAYMQQAKVTRTFCRKATEKEALAELKDAGINFKKTGDKVTIY